MASLEGPNRIIDPGGMIIAKEGVLTEEFEVAIRNIVREEVKKMIDEQAKMRGWQPIKPWPPMERK